MTAIFERGDVAWHPAPYRDNPDTGRPFVILSDDQHPFHGEEYIVAALTTVPRPEALTLEASDWIQGGTPRDSYVSPWYVMSLKQANFDGGIGRLEEKTIERIARDVSFYLGVRSR